MPRRLRPGPTVSGQTARHLNDCKAKLLPYQDYARNYFPCFSSIGQTARKKMKIRWKTRPSVHTAHPLPPQTGAVRPAELSPHREADSPKRNMPDEDPGGHPGRMQRR